MKKQTKETKKVTVKADVKEKTMNAFETITPVLLKYYKEMIYGLVGQAYVTGKRVPIPKQLYDVITKEERIALRAILDAAQERKDLK